MSLLSKPMTFGLDAKVKGLFFDRALVKGMTDEATARGLNKAGAYVRKAMIRGMRRKGNYKPSAPGNPPFFQNIGNETVSLRNILYHYSPENKTVVVGPVKLNQYQYAGGSTGVISRGTVPATHEFGGTIGIREKLIPFSLAIAFKLYGKQIGNTFKTLGMFMPRSEALKIHGEQRVDDAAGGTWIPAGRRKNNRVVQRVRDARFPRRAFALPALERSLKKIPEQFGGRVQSQ